eukprot:CAMPEP_0113939872 /NCGR_PEP_ID=MMETSP1339-20121228/6111_1 /TAXON_ID=94617 /ORGANISM="Fibrocapsa japonica" /LENGTH=205 /DNA_ID=CAMNT_0000943503 /DNA_START=311 /DNA_END=929 /DNA_ORIENTATION=- /assembly_acc=CAM_ASM_000762
MNKMDEHITKLFGGPGSREDNDSAFSCTGMHQKHGVDQGTQTSPVLVLSLDSPHDANDVLRAVYSHDIGLPISFGLGCISTSPDHQAKGNLGLATGLVVGNTEELDSPSKADSPARDSGSVADSHERTNSNLDAILSELESMMVLVEDAYDQKESQDQDQDQDRGQVVHVVVPHPVPVPVPVPEAPVVLPQKGAPGPDDAEGGRE